MKIIAYSFEADNHCIACTRQRFTPDTNTGTLDGEGVPVNARDSEGNPIHPIFSTDEQLEPLYCGDCGKEIKP